MVIALDGAEGTGKTTQAKILAARLRERGKLVLEVREPGSTFVGEQIRSILLDVKNKDIDWKTEVFLFFAARAEMMRQVHEHLALGGVVILDRFFGATYAYQHGLSLHELWQFAKFACGDLKFRCFVLDMPVEKRRVKDIRDRIEQKSEAYHQDVRNRYRILCNSNPEYFEQVPVEDLSIEQVAEELWRRLA